MKKVLYLLLVSGSAGVYGAGPKKAATPVKKATTTATTKTTVPQSTSTLSKSKSTVSSSGSTTSSGSKETTSSQSGGSVSMDSSKGTVTTGSLNVSGGTSGSSFSSSEEGGTPTVSNAYVVVPEDKDPDITYLPTHQSEHNNMISFMGNLTSAGYTHLVGPSKQVIPDTSLRASSKTSLMASTLGSYNASGDFISASKPLTTKEALVRNLTEGAYKVDRLALAKAIQGGEFSGRLLRSRMLIQEFFLGQLAVTTPAFVDAGAKIFEPNDLKFLHGFSQNLQTEFKRTRYLRSGLEPGSGGNSETFVIGKGKLFTPADFFVGVIVVNNSRSAFDNNKIAVEPGGIGFLPLPSNVYMNDWSNIAQRSSTGLPARKPMRLSELGTGAGGGFELEPSADQQTISIGFDGKTFTPESFGTVNQQVQVQGKRINKRVLLQELFFKDLVPWAVIVEVSGGRDPQFLGIAKMNVIDYAKYLNIADADQSSTNSTQTASQGSQSSATSSYTLFDVINAPDSLYRMTYPITQATGKRSVSSSVYPQGQYFAQGLMNGVLENSSYRPLAVAVSMKEIESVEKVSKDFTKMLHPRFLDKFSLWGKKSVKKSKKKTSVNLPKATYKPSIAQSTAISNAYPAPNPMTMLGAYSGNNWLFLRSLIITKAVLGMSGISEKLLSTRTPEGTSLFGEVLKYPTKSIITNSSEAYSQSPSGGSSQASDSMTRGFTTAQSQSASTAQTHSVQSKKVTNNVRKKSTSSTSKTQKTIWYIGTKINQPEPYIPVLLVSGDSSAQQQSSKTSSSTNSQQSSDSSSAISAYENGYKAGLKLRGSSKGNSHSSSSSESTSQSSSSKGNASASAYRRGYEAGLRSVHSSINSSSNNEHKSHDSDEDEKEDDGNDNDSDESKSQIMQGY